MNLAGKVAVVTGAAGGIGRALVERLVAEGCRVAAVDRDEAGLADVARALGERVTVHVVDLRDVEALERLPEQVVAAHGAVHLLVQNAGLTVHGAFVNHAAADIDRVIDVDLRAVLHGARVFLPHLRAAGEAHLVNISSMASLYGVPFQSTYSAAKAAVRAFSEALRVELAPLGVGVTAVLPGTIATGFLRAAHSHDTRASGKMAELMLRFGTRPERVAERVVRAIRSNRHEIRVGWDVHLTALVRRVAPWLLRWGLGLGYRLGVRDGKLRGGG